MGVKTLIGWCDSSVNPTAGCDGCELWKPRPADKRDDRSERGGCCYAGNLHTRFQASGNSAYDKPFELPVIKPGRMAKAAGWADLAGKTRPDKPWLEGRRRMVFISDMGDAMSRAIDFDYLKTEIIDTVAAWPHVGLWLTKQPARMAEFSRWLAARDVAWPEHLVAMTSVTGRGTESRVGQLLGVRCRYRGVSAEPLHSCPDWGRLFRNWPIDWLILGGASNQPKNPAKPCRVEWIESGVRLAQRYGVPTFVKQLGSNAVTLAPCDRCRNGLQAELASSPCSKCGGVGRVDRVLDFTDGHGAAWGEWPNEVCVREVPEFPPSNP